MRAGSAGSHHGKGWETFTDEVIRVTNTREFVVFVLWGANARRKKQLIDTDRHAVGDFCDPGVSRGGIDLTNQRRLLQLPAEGVFPRPLTDDQIAQRLHEQGISVTRRTVAKYRSELNILPSHLRKVY